MLLPLDAAADRDDALGLRQIDGLPRFLERRLRLLPDRGGIDRDRHLPYGRGAMRRVAPHRRGTRRSGRVTRCGVGPSASTSAFSLP